MKSKIEEKIQILESKVLKFYADLSEMFGVSDAPARIELLVLTNDIRQAFLSELSEIEEEAENKISYTEFRMSGLREASRNYILIDDLKEILDKRRGEK